MERMTFQKIASEIAKREGKKSKVKIGDVREILKVLVDFEVDYYLETNLLNGPLDYLHKSASGKIKKRVGKK